MPHHLQEPGLPQGALTQACRQAFRLRPLRQGVPQPQEPPHAQEGSPPARGEVSILILRKQYRNFYAKKRINRYGMDPNPAVQNSTFQKNLNSLWFL